MTHIVSFIKRKNSNRGSEKQKKSSKSITKPVNEWLTPERLAWIMLPFLSVIISILIFPDALIKPKKYKIGDIAEKDIKATHEFLIEDSKLTEKKREEAAKSVFSVFDHDPLGNGVKLRITKAFETARKLQNQFFLENKGDNRKISKDKSLTKNQIKERFFRILEIPSNDFAFRVLYEYQFPVHIQKILQELTTDVYKRGVVNNKFLLLNHMRKGAIILRDISSGRERSIKNPGSIYDTEEAKAWIKEKLKSQRTITLSRDMKRALNYLATSLITPNVWFNKKETEKRKTLAAQAVKPSYTIVKKGEMIVREGERIGPEHLIKLKHEMKRRTLGGSISRIGGMALLMGILFSVIYMVILKGAEGVKKDKRELVFNITLLLTAFLFAVLYRFISMEISRNIEFFSFSGLFFAMPIFFSSMLISIFQGIPTAICFSLVISIILSILSGGSVEHFLYFFIGNLIALYGVRSCTQRGTIIKTGVILGIVNMVIITAINLMSASVNSFADYMDALSGFGSGIISGVIATGLLPLIEMIFGFTTEMRLLELGNLDHPLLRELMIRAPGTYHHSLVISHLVEATAKAIRANPLLAKVSAYYHDIGKMKKPLYFIENQIDGINRHEKLAPSMSSLILISHVKEGVELAKKYRLGREITDIIQQHHGTNLISFFYQKAVDLQQRKGDRSSGLDEEHFRYPGPKPQTKEAGLVMLADMVEAASRSLKDPSPARIKGLVQKIINRAFSEGQLDECELTLRDLNEIAKNFNKILGGIFHQRIEYSEIQLSKKRREGNGDSAKIPKEDTWDKKPGDKGEFREGLKRLGT